MDNNSEKLRYAGLNDKEVEDSRLEHGVNLLTPPPRDPWWKLFLEKFDDPVIRILMIAAVLAIMVGTVDGKYLEGVGIVVAILLATFLAFVNEYRANREFDVLNQVNEEAPVKVIRNGNPTAVPKKDLVVDDIVLLDLGEEAPADAEILEAVLLLVNESRLTGESLPVRKVAKGRTKPASESQTAYPPDHLLKGTTIAEGQAIARITAVGDHTEIGKTARAAAEETHDQTPLAIQLGKLSKIIGIVGFSVAAILYAVLVARAGFALTYSQWYFLGAASAGVVLALLPLFLPILYDALQLMGKKAELPQWLERSGMGKWLKSLALGTAVAVALVSMGIALDFLSTSPETWLPVPVLEKLVRYFMVAVTVIVVCVPEGLAMSVTLSLAYSMRKMIASNVLVRRMHACETIGATTVICTDKTGTLTLNEMKVQETHFPCLEGKTLSAPDDAGHRVIESLCVNSSAHLTKTDEGKTEALGNPTEGALLLYLHEQGISYLDRRSAFTPKCQWPFNSELKYMAVIGNSAHGGKSLFYVKGASEIVLAASASIMTVEGIVSAEGQRSAIESEIKGYQKRGMRTLGFAYRELPGECHEEDLEKIFHDLTWLGFVAIADALRPDVGKVIATCRRAGIMVKMVTGDSSATAMEIARQAGLLGNGECLTGPQFADLKDEEARAAALRVNVFSRARPMDKLKLVSLLKAQGHVVAVTGDGTNDAPALNHANVGLAMGKTGTSVAKEASDIVILDDAFHSIVNAVMWGRTLYQNIQKFLVFQLTINVSALGIVLLGPFIGIEIPLTVTQMLWVNMIMDTFAALALATEPPQKDIMYTPPRSPESFIITKSMAAAIFGTGLVFLAMLASILFYLHQDGITSYELSFFFTLFVMLQFWNLFNAKCMGSSRSAFVAFFSNKPFLLIAALILCGQILIVEFGGEVFSTVPLEVSDWLIIAAGTSAVLLIGEVVRGVQRFLMRARI